MNGDKLLHGGVGCLAGILIGYFNGAVWSMAIYGHEFTLITAISVTSCVIIGGFLGSRVK